MMKEIEKEIKEEIKYLEEKLKREKNKLNNLNKGDKKLRELKSVFEQKTNTGYYKIKTHYDNTYDAYEYIILNKDSTTIEFDCFYNYHVLKFRAKKLCTINDKYFFYDNRDFTAIKSSELLTDYIDKLIPLTKDKFFKEVKSCFNNEIKKLK